MQVPELGVLRIAVLMTCHNRRALTLECLDSVARCAQHASACANVNIFLVDDASSDGTGEAVRERFPQVHVIQGTGSLYWCGGMRAAWREAAIRDYDAYLWLNDDVVLDMDAISRLMAVMTERKRSDGAVIAVGATRDGQGSDTSYGALDANGVIAPSDVVRRIDLFNGNVVLVSRRAYQVLGGLSGVYTHGLGDIDYGIRARKAGVPAWLAAGSVGVCPANKRLRWQRRDLSVWGRLRELHRPTGCPPLQLGWLLWCNGNWFFPWSVAKLYWQALFPGREVQ